MQILINPFDPPRKSTLDQKKQIKKIGWVDQKFEVGKVMTRKNLENVQKLNNCELFQDLPVWIPIEIFEILENFRKNSSRDFADF